MTTVDTRWELIETTGAVWPAMPPELEPLDWYAAVADALADAARIATWYAARGMSGPSYRVRAL